MLGNAKQCFCLCFAISFYFTAQAQVDSSKTTAPASTDSVIIIRKIEIDGNRITRPVIILRELPFKEGDTIKVNSFPALLAQGNTQVLNLSLFSIKDFSIDVSAVEASFVDIKITVKERWYILPAPYLKPVDRSLSEWLFEKNARVSRLDYGLKLYYYNVSGSNDRLKFYFVTGYTKQLKLSYNRPYVDKKMKWGINFSLAVSKTHEINAGTKLNNTPDFIGGGGNEYLQKFFETGLELTHRPAFYTTHIFGAGYHTLRVADTVLKRNPNFLNHNATIAKIPELYYRLEHTKLDYIPYPTKGYAAELMFSVKGFNKKLNVWQLSAKGAGYWHLGAKSFYGISALGMLKLPHKQPFYTSQLLGYGDMTLSGYEYFVIDGTAAAILKASIARQIANFSFKPPILKKWTSSLIPLKIYAKVFGNAGYAHNPQPWATQLNNRMLFGGGIGFDIFTDYDFTLRLELSINHLGQSRFFSEKKTVF